MLLGIIVAVLFLIWRRSKRIKLRHCTQFPQHHQEATEKEDFSKVENINPLFKLKDDSPITADDVKKDTEVTTEHKM